MTRDDFIEKIENGRDILFEVAGKQFTILTWMDEGIGIGERNCPQKPIQYFSTAQELVDGFMIHDISLSSLIHTAKITDYS